MSSLGPLVFPVKRSGISLDIIGHLWPAVGIHEDTLHRRTDSEMDLFRELSQEEDSVPPG